MTLDCAWRSLASLFVSFLLLAGETEAQESPTINKKCPVMTRRDVGPDDFVVTWKGKPVRLCCKKCVRRFRADPDRYVPRLPQFNESEPHREPALGPEVKPRQDPSPSAALDRDSPRSASDDGSRVIPRRDWLGALHPAAVHFPIAMLLLAALLEPWNLVRRRTLYGPTVRLLLWTGVVGSLVSAGLGLAAAELQETTGDVFEEHRLLGFATVVASVLTLALGETLRRGSNSLRVPYLILLGVSAAAVGLAGHWGAALVHGPIFPS